MRLTTITKADFTFDKYSICLYFSFAFHKMYHVTIEDVPLHWYISVRGLLLVREMVKKNFGRLHSRSESKEAYI